METSVVGFSSRSSKRTSDAPLFFQIERERKSTVKHGEERESWRLGEATTEPAGGEGGGEKRCQPSAGRWTGGAAAT
jgi:hypothetical protein